MFKKLLVFVQVKIENVIRRKENVTNHIIEVMEYLRIYNPWFAYFTSKDFVNIAYFLLKLLLHGSAISIYSYGLCLAVAHGLKSVGLVPSRSLVIHCANEDIVTVGPVPEI